MILFLDFDGVLHPIPTEKLLCYIPRLENVLRQFPYVKVVISSLWRACGDLTELQEYFSEDIRPRIIGMTPFIENEPSTEWGLVFCKTRYHEILQWIDDNDYTGPWVALDDAYKEFPKNCKELIRCETVLGFDEEAKWRLVRYMIEH